MKKLVLFFVVVTCGVVIVQAQPTISDPNIVSTITPKQIDALGNQHQNTNRSIFYLSFEGLGNNDAVNNFYNGGTSGQGYSGTNYGVEFGIALGKIDADAGGNGNFANEPSPSTIMFFLNSANQAYMNVAAGFTNGFSCYYAAGYSGSIQVFDGLSGTGNLLGTINLPINNDDYNTCTGDPTGWYCNWDPVGIAISGTAKSVVFIGPADYVGFDDVTFGSITPGPPPIPVSDWAIYFAILLIGIAIWFRFKTRIA